MKFVVDENLPREVAGWLIQAGHEACHICDIGFAGRSDRDIWERATACNEFIVTRDSDFMVLASGSATGGVVRLRIGNCSTPTLLARIEQVWPEVLRLLAAGSRVIEIG
jgi:predicted nuclease of predicted toxin-antitoxin system